MSRALAVLALLALAGCEARAPEVRAGLDVTAALGGGTTEGYERAVAPRAFTFPADHGPHPSFRTEWWYVTGNLASADGRRYGFQLTFFRNALAPSAVSRSSAWATREVYMAHFALTDGAAGRFAFAQRFARGGALGLAGATAEPFRAWLDDWSIAQRGPAPFPWTLTAHDGANALVLELDRGPEPVLQGDAGLSRKGPEPGNASYYYSLTRMPARGRLTFEGRAVDVQGSAWLDREWSTSALSPDLAGWDWFALQLDGGRELMFYRLRTKDGGTSPFSAGTLREPSGVVRVLHAADVRLVPAGTWTSPHTGAVYPSAWRLAIPSAALDLDVRPLVADQELRTIVHYWEGAVTVSGSAAGRGYVELTGYGGTR